MNLKLDDHPTRTRFAEGLAADSRRATRLGVQLSVLRERLVAQLRSALPEALYVFVPSGVDQVERVLLGMEAGLSVLEAHRTLVVDG